MQSQILAGAKWRMQKVALELDSLVLSKAVNTIGYEVHILHRPDPVWSSLALFSLLGYLFAMN